MERVVERVAGSLPLRYPLSRLFVPAKNPRGFFVLTREGGGGSIITCMYVYKYIINN